MDENEEQNQFVVDEVGTIIKQTIEDCIGGNAYQQIKVNLWTTNIVEHVLQTLAKSNKNFKYIVTCTIMQKTGAGLHSASSCYWDNNTDGTCTVRWENKTIYDISFFTSKYKLYNVITSVRSNCDADSRLAA